MNKFIPLSVPNIRGSELRYVTEALESEWVSTGGAMINAFEMNIAEYVKAKGAVACQSGTAGLHMALHYYNVQATDAVIVPTLTFIAAVNPVKYEHAEPIFMDCDDSLCMDPVKLKKYLDEECIFEDGKVKTKSSHRTIKAIIVVHVFGNMADMEAIMRIASLYNLPVIEDATEALGTYYTEGEYKGQYAGTIGDVGVYSFNGNKIITTGGGGMVVSQDQEILDKIKYLSTQAKDDAVNFIHNEVGFNYRMTNVQAAIGLAQSECLESFIRIKAENYQLYKEKLKGNKFIKLLDFKKGIRSNHWFYSIVLQDEKFKRDEIISHLKDKNIQSRPIWGLISNQLPYINSEEYQIEKAIYFHDRIINIPCSSNLSSDDVEIVTSTLNEILV